MAGANNLPGLYVVFDGIIGCGKSEQIKQLKKYTKKDFPKREFIFTYEPGGTKDADKLRKRLKNNTMSPLEEMNLYLESRSITLPEIVKPALERQGIVISDRSFTTSLAYQAWGRELGLTRVWQANQRTVGSMYPDVLIFINVGLDKCLYRSSEGDVPDKFDKESRVFWQRTNNGYEHMLIFLKEISPNTKIIRIDDHEGKLTIEDTRLRIKSALYPLIKDNIDKKIPVV